MERDERVLSDRRKALEEEFFRKQNEKLKEEIRAKQDRERVRKELADAFPHAAPETRDRFVDEGLDAEAVSALALVPCVMVAWADGQVGEKERNAVLTAAREHGLEPGHQAAHSPFRLARRAALLLADRALEPLRRGRPRGSRARGRGADSRSRGHARARRGPRHGRLPRREEDLGARGSDARPDRGSLPALTPVAPAPRSTLSRGAGAAVPCAPCRCCPARASKPENGGS